jgi:hypothetical protein
MLDSSSRAPVLSYHAWENTGVPPATPKAVRGSAPSARVKRTLWSSSTSTLAKSSLAMAA